MAGLSAAYKLVTSNCTEFIIVEAQDVVGGRVRSVNLADGGRIDLGAQWLHGERQNPIYNWLESLGCIDGPEKDEVEFEGLFLAPDGQRPPSFVVSRVLEILLETKNHLYHYASLASNSCRPIDIFHKVITEAKNACPTLSKVKVELVDAIERWFVLYETIDNSCVNLDDLSIKAYSGWSNFDDGKIVKLKGGWQRVVDKLEEIVGGEKIKLNAQVEQIQQQEGGKVLVKLGDGENIACDHVILTTSLGVLKKAIERPSTFLLPHLEDSRCRSINKLGFGTVNKVFLRFSEPYLQNEQAIKLLPTESKKVSIPKWVSGVLSFDLVREAPDVILVWIGGEGAEEVEKISDQELSETLLEVLRACLPENPPPRLVSIIRSNWSSNPYIGGAYSYPSVASVDIETTNLWDPVCDKNGIPKILFAGEATAGDMYATAHGAVISGWREADRLLALSSTDRSGDTKDQHSSC